MNYSWQMDLYIFELGFFSFGSNRMEIFLSTMTNYGVLEVVALEYTHIYMYFSFIFCIDLQ